MLYGTDSHRNADIICDAQPLAARIIRGPAIKNSPCKGYPWPASRLTQADMQKLTEMRNKTGRPITVLLHDAVSALYELLRDTKPNIESGS